MNQEKLEISKAMGIEIYIDRTSLQMMGTTVFYAKIGEHLYPITTEHGRLNIENQTEIREPFHHKLCEILAKEFDEWITETKKEMEETT